MKRRTVELVVDRSDACTLLWPSTDLVRAASNTEAIGAFALEIARDESVPEVTQGAPTGRFHKLAAGLIDSYFGTQPDTEVKTALHLVLMVDDTDLVVVWPPAGRCRTAQGAAALGKLLEELLDDQSQPRCPSGPPPDATTDLFERGAAGLGQLLRSAGSETQDGGG
mgnify:CR=1 FL=1